ncbi:cyclase family protein [Mesorhizobium sp. CAU 1732]|uniref:cyclase family protein n=1 Tax=Mesorhizobium sp. CAU 1732 TaxID=3140358 RepID=UPI003261B09E
MCHHCVIETVKSRMLSRRDLFRGSAAVASVAAIAATAAPKPLFAQSAPMKAEDLTHELHENFPSFDGEQQVFIEPKYKLDPDGYNLNIWRLEEHIGTHIDAPLHFSADGRSVAELPVEDLVCPLAIIDIRAKAAESDDAQVTPDDIAAWISANGDLPEGVCVAMLSGWGEHVTTDKFRNADEAGTMHFPGFHVEATNMLIEQSSAKAIAVDTMSLDFGQSPDFAVHYSWLPSGRYGIEGVANLDRLPASGATIIVGAPKMRGGTGGPARVFAVT